MKEKIEEHIDAIKQLISDFDFILDNQKIKYQIGQKVYLRTDVEQHERMITGYLVRRSGVLYYVTLETNESGHYDFEISAKKDETKALFASD